MLQPVDDPNPIKIQPEYVPKDSYLYKLISGTSMIPVTKDSTGAVKTSSTRTELEVLKTYIETGIVEPDKMETFFEVSDYYGTYTLKANYKPEFLSIKMKEDWLRKVFNVDKQDVQSNKQPDSNPNSIKSNLFRLIELTQTQLESFKLVSNIHYLYAYKVAAPKTNLSVAGLITRNTSNHLDEDTLNTLLNERYPSRTTKRDIDNFLASSKTLVSHRYPRTHVTGSSKTKLLKRIQQTADEFNKRDKLFEDDLIRESKRTSRNLSAITCGCDNRDLLPSSWQQSVEQVYATIQSYPVCKIFNTKPDIWNNIVLAGGSVSNAVLHCNLQVDYDLFIYGMSEEQANKKVVECIKLLSSHHKHIEIRRSKNAITYIAQHQTSEWYRPKRIEIQFILRLFTTISEVLHGFDVDSCCVGFDGKRVVMTERADYAFRYMVNTVDFDRLSPSYEFRLHKYMERGFSVNIPGFKWKNVDFAKLLRYRNGYDENGGNGSLPAVPTMNSIPGLGMSSTGLTLPIGFTLPSGAGVIPQLGSPRPSSPRPSSPQPNSSLPTLPRLDSPRPTTPVAMAPVLSSTSMLSGPISTFPGLPTFAPAFTYPGIPTFAPAPTYPGMGLPTFAPAPTYPGMGLPMMTPMPTLPVLGFPALTPYPPMPRRGRYRGYTTGYGGFAGYGTGGTDGTSLEGSSYSRNTSIHKHLKQLKGIEILINGHFVSSYKGNLTLSDDVTDSDYDTKAAKTQRLEAEKIKLGLNKDDEIISYSVEHHFGELESISQIFNFVLPDRYKYKFKISTQLEWLKSKLGEEVSGTFHKSVLDDVELWYTNRFMKDTKTKVEKDADNTISLNELNDLMSAMNATSQPSSRSPSPKRASAYAGSGQTDYALCPGCNMEYKTLTLKKNAGVCGRCRRRPVATMPTTAAAAATSTLRTSLSSSPSDGEESSNEDDEDITQEDI